MASRSFISVVSVVVVGLLPFHADSFFTCTNAIRPTHSISTSQRIQIANNFAGWRSCLASTANVAAPPSAAAADDDMSALPPATFREAEVLGLRLMQEGRHEDALKVFKDGMKLPGSKSDVVRTQSLPGPSPVGGSAGGREGKIVMSLDEFEMQAAHYNIACAYACTGNVAESVANLQKSFECGFDNYATVRVDPDLGSVHGTPEFEALMDKVDKKNKFPNPFSLFG
mmetsp:Transcript_28914/g.42866  ORF Transcript_28914/g.42866 Transcript_28914/m.42866 type:complete len:227 (-) Transcript_28914:265-945(-)|eukprot:CAMPEP_0195521006 /NCGR_PEP_ID=MMETSP0794_2-20130614/17764_1 /TAXON_ID=515487 /ORGANISM="Stephanopyxis turris, Strain CCMP 815" /LENGTH=226 /DNA_ID=CAMNT_0040650461 /DNA_START=41 /DNA_END=721 /DNA_ORIENTATION=+